MNRKQCQQAEDMAPSIGLVAKLLVICIVSALLLVNQSDCFSTPRARGPARSSTRSTNNLGAEPEFGTENKENAYLENFITAIECELPNSDERGFMVATTDHNYAIYSPALESQDWLTLTVNGDKVFIMTTEKRTLSTWLFALDEEQRDFIAELRGNFTQNLAGLKFAHYTSGSSTYLSRPSTSSVASIAISQMEHSKAGPLSLMPPGAATSAYVEIEPTTPRPLERPSEAGLLQSNGLPPSAEGFFSRGLGKRTLARYRAPSRLAWRARNGYNPSANAYNGPGEIHYPIARPSAGYAKGPDVGKSLCSPDRLNDNFNYYNLLQTPLNATLTGDVYYFDLHCNILDVYSASVSVRQAQGLSALYRNASFFSYARSAMPLAINRFFLSNEQVFFVYNDGSLLVKMDWMLDQAELDLVIEALQQLKLIANWQGLAADLQAKSVAKRKS